MIYVFAEDYPSEKKQYAMTYVHSRNLVYKEKGLNVKVISMRSKECYIFEGIEVITKKDFLNIVENDLLENNDVIISHAPNLKNHLTLIEKVYKKVGKIIFVFHGHEVLKTSLYYPKNYPFKRKNILNTNLHKAYDLLKLKLLKYSLLKINKQKKLELFFVSRWMKNHASKCLKLNFKDFQTHIINNNASNYFIDYTYKRNEDLFADFITVRPLDNSKYAIDQVVALANNNPNYTFHIYGKGEYFKYNKLPSNIEVKNQFIQPKDFPELLNKYKYALMPTRLDAQGVMVCEMATYGIPTITSDLDVCKEMLGGFKNVYLAESSFFYKNIDPYVLNSIDSAVVNKTRFTIENTVLKEVEILNN